MIGQGELRTPHASRLTPHASRRALTRTKTICPPFGGHNNDDNNIDDNNNDDNNNDDNNNDDNNNDDNNNELSHDIVLS